MPKQMMNTESKRAILFAAAAAVLYACSVPLSKLLLGGVPPVLMAGFFYLGAGIGAVFLLLLRGRAGKAQGLRAFERKDIPFVAGMILLDVLAPVLLFSGLQKTTAANASLLNNFEIAATALIALFLFREPVSRRLWLAIALVTAASCLITFDKEGGLAFSVGSVYVLLAAACWGVENNCTKMLSERNPLAIVALKGIGSGSCSLAIGLALGQRASGTPVVLLTLVVGFLTYGLSIACYIRAQRALGAAKTSAYYAAAPFIGAVLSFLLLGERPNAVFIGALLLMGVGAYFATFDRPKTAPPAE